MEREIKIIHGLGYDEAFDLQTEAVKKVASNEAEPEKIFLVEHKPLITMGASEDSSNLLVSEDELSRRGIELSKTRRGGKITYHGPGQWTVYPILRLKEKNLHKYMRRLEDVVIKYIAGHNINGTRREGLTGVWVGKEKIAAIGIAVRRWVSFHGFAVNVQPELENFTRHMIPCGIQDGGVCSLASLTGKEYDMDEEAQKIIEVLAGEF